MKAELEVKVELWGAEEQIEIQRALKKIPIDYINRLEGRIWALKFVLDQPRF